jgi:TonB-linked SusC/RagA family outer membrane protein
VTKEKRTVKKLLDLVLGKTTLTYKEEAGTVVILKKKTTSTIDPETPSATDQAEVTFFPITGTVKDRNGVPLPGVNVVVKGTTRGTSTDAEGKFAMDVSEGEIIVLSFIGYKTIEISLESLTVIDVVMEEDITTLKTIDIVSTNYFSTTKTKSTMNIAKVVGTEIENQPVTSLISSLVGRVAGLDITPVNGAPGSVSTIQIRGNNSLSARGSYPLYVIDGVQIDSKPLRSGSVSNYFQGFDPLSGISPGDIESIEVLKDGASTAIYGSRGANGVIRITTKRSNVKQRTDFDLNVYSGVGQIPNTVELLNSTEYLAMRRQAYANQGITPQFYIADLAGIWDTTRYTDWQDVLLGGTAKISDVQGSFSGGDENNSFRIGGGYHRETTIYPGDNSFQRANATASFYHLSRNKKVEISSSINFGWTRNKTYDNSSFVTMALTLPPVAPQVYNEDGSLNWELFEYASGVWIHTWNNPLANLLNTDNNKSHSLISNSTISFELMPGLHARTVVSLSQIVNDQVVKYPIMAQAPYNRSRSTGLATFSSNDRNSIMIEPQLTFVRSFGDHNINTIVGATWQKSETIYESYQGRDYPSDGLMGSIRGAKTIMNLADDRFQYKYASLYAHIGYDFKSKYLVDITGRRDGSSRFGPGKRYGNFGALSLGWIFSEEGILKRNGNFLSFGKVRSSYGVTGNDQIDDYQYLNTYSILPVGYQDGISLGPTALFNPDYAWEETRKFEIALELGFFENRVMIEGSLYSNRSSNQLVRSTLAATTGFPSVLENFDAVIENKGLEVVVSTRNIAKDNFTWTSSFNLTVPRNELLRFDGIETSPFADIYKVGEPLSIQKLFVYEGVNPESGLYNVADLNEDGNYNNIDRVFSSPLGRTSYYGLTNTLRYRNFELSFLLQFSNNPSKQFLFEQLPGTMNNQPVGVLDRWQGTDDVAAYQKFLTFDDGSYVNNMLSSDRNLTDASFIRLKTLSLSYRFPSEFLSKFRIRQGHIFLQGQNLLTRTDYYGLDPETGNNLPPLRTFTVGLNIKI